MTLNRNIFNYAKKLLSQFPVLAIIGARQVGKTVLAKSLGQDWLYMDLERPGDFDHLVRDSEFFFKQYPEHVIFDEVQLSPQLFSTLRSVIDEKRQQKNRFILTGSSSPELLSRISESLAGRIVVIELGTLKANEYYHKPLSPFYEIFQQSLSKENIVIHQPQLTISQVQEFWFKGGYPEPILESEEFYEEWMIAYQAAYINRDIATLFPKLDKIAYRRFINMLGSLSSKIINKSDLARSIGVSQPTISDYLDIAEGTFLWRRLSGFEKNASKSIVKMPRGHIRDSGLLHHLLNINSLKRLQQDPIAGFSFEAFVIEEILKGLQDAHLRQVNAYYYRTRNGAEIDLILEGPFGVVPIEIKYGYQVARGQLRHLNEFVIENQLPFGILINQSEKIEWLTEHIIQIPAGCL